MRRRYPEGIIIPFGDFAWLLSWFRQMGFRPEWGIIRIFTTVKGINRLRVSDALDCIREITHNQDMWTVRHTNEFQAWFDQLDEKKQTRVLAKTYVLKLHGPTLGRPTVDTVKGSTIKNLKEMRFTESGSIIRVLFYFDEARSALLLIGGDKRGKNQKDFYASLIDQAENIIKRYNYGD